MITSRGCKFMGDRVERHIIKESNKLYRDLDHLTFLSKNLYNATLYSIRQHYFKTKGYLNYYDVNKEFTHTNQVDYRALPAKVSKWTQMLVDKNMKSFFALVKKKDTKVRLPRYLDKNGRQLVFYEKGALSLVKEGYIKLSKTDIYIKTNVAKDKIRFVRLVPKGNHIVVEVGYRVGIKEHKHRGRYASIDLGINNLMTLSSNVIEPLIINGRPLKSINQYYNKRLARMKSNLWEKEKRKSSRRISGLHLKRSNKVTDYLHKSSRCVVNYLVSNQIDTLVIGYNPGWKQNITLGSMTNQKFIQVPFKQLIDKLIYKCVEVGIQVDLQEESYTSLCSFIDNEDVKKHSKYVGKRIKRGLYTSESRININADLNGSLNILKKYLIKKAVWDEFLHSDCIEVSSAPNLKVVSL